MIDQMSAFLQRLRKSTAGNTLAIAAAALVPLVGMVGGAVDISRYYMAVARMQNACDAGALAARKQMEAGEFEEADRALGLRFFDHNYPDGTFGLENLDRDYVADEDGTVTGTATGDMPTTIMQIFGKTGMDIAVSCSAEINISNTDIMFVLDVTGSMNCPDDAAAGTCLNNGNVEAWNARIKGLRTAVAEFYDVVADATSDAAQIRYGIVPYASNVNVGASIPSEYMATSHTYQSRGDPVFKWITLNTTIDGYSNEGSTSHSQELYWDGWKNREWKCENEMPAAVPLSYVPGSFQEGTVEVVSETQDGNIRTREITGSGILREVVPSYDYNSYYDTCKTYSNVTEFRADLEITIVEEQQLDYWTYKPYTYDISNIIAGGSSTYPIGPNVSDVTVSWNNGCIEEAKSVATSTWDPVPASAYDLDINLKPTTNDEKWKPILPELVWKRENPGNHYGWLYQWWDENRPSFNCPKAAFRLTEIERDDLVSYLEASNGFIARSSTYHDIGMIWGARFISPYGIFQTDNEAAPNGDSIARHLIFMTDGELMVDDELYGTYGIEYWDRRVSPDGSNSSDFHRARFLAACRQARANGITVWVVAFGTALTPDLKACAGDDEHDFIATTGPSLSEEFKKIAQKIAALRLTS